MSWSLCTAIVLGMALCVAGCGGEKTIESGDQPTDTTDDRPSDDQSTGAVVEQPAAQPTNVDTPDGDTSGLAGALGRSFLRALSGGDEDEVFDKAPEFQP